MVQQVQRSFNIGGTSVYRNHPAEMYAIVAALEWLPGQHRGIEIISDSQPAVRALNPPTPQLKKQLPVNAEKQQRQQHIDELTERYRHATSRHGHVLLTFKPRATREIAAADALARKLGETVRAQNIQR